MLQNGFFNETISENKNYYIEIIDIIFNGTIIAIKSAKRQFQHSEFFRTGKTRGLHNRTSVFLQRLQPQHKRTGYAI